MPDEPVTEQRPLLLRHERHQIPLNFLRRLLPCQSEPLRQPCDVGVHDDTNVDAERVAQNDVGRLAPDAAQLDQFLHGLRDLPAVFFNDSLAGRPEVARFVPKKAGGLDGLFQFRQRRIRVILRRTVLFE